MRLELLTDDRERILKRTAARSNEWLMGGCSWVTGLRTMGSCFRQGNATTLTERDQKVAGRVRLLVGFNAAV